LLLPPYVNHLSIKGKYQGQDARKACVHQHLQGGFHRVKELIVKPFWCHQSSGKS
jgi:hypothetical protein